MINRAAIPAIFIIMSAMALTARASNITDGLISLNRTSPSFTSGSEEANALARLGGGEPARIRERLSGILRPTNQPDPEVVRKIVEAQHLSIATGRRVEQLRAALQPALDYHGRGGLPVYVLWSDQPKAYLVARAVIIITTRMMSIASDEEIRGIVAHELAHEYVWDERAEALQTKNGRLMRECEFFCDAVAAFTLREIGDDPASYGRILERVTFVGIEEGSAMRHESITHPSLYSRKKLNRFLCQLLRQTAV
jgi:hypothetical protein